MGLFSCKGWFLLFYGELQTQLAEQEKDSYKRGFGIEC